MLHISGRLQGYDELKAKFAGLPSVVNKATASALNKIGRQGVTAAKRSITNTYNIKSGEAAKGVNFTAAKASGADPRLFVVITARGDRIGLHKFGGLPTTPPSQAGVPVLRRKLATVKILKAASRRSVTRDAPTGHMPFVAGMRSGHIGIFVRTGEKSAGKEKIRELKSRGIAEIFQKAGIKAIDRLLAEKGRSMLEHELSYFLEKEMKKK
jgi:hypothetical protein